jgi:regulator of replication initiation timing
MTEMQEQARALGHIDLVLSQLPMDVLQELQMSATMQEMNVCAEKTSNELVKVMTENVALEMEYNKVKQECDEAMQKVERMQQAFEKVYQELPEVQTEKEALVEDQVMKISESIQGFCT